ncbi:MAG: chemotaxis protein CheD [Oscillospiraceae bacterium]
MANTITVGISDLNVIKSPDSLVTYALGSCVGICIYDKLGQIAGMAHIMLPSINESSSKENIYKFADSGIVELIRKMELQGAKKVRMVAKIAGGAQMFKVTGKSLISNIGERNVISVKNVLKSLGIRIIAEDTGLDYGRTIVFNGVDGSLTVKSVGRDIKTI